jgi:hypothetical protein
MVAETKKMSALHLRALKVSAALTGYYRDMYRRGAAMISPKKVIRVLNEAGVRYVLMGTHGLGGWRSEPRATQDVDVLVAKKDHAKAVRAIKKAFPNLVMTDTFIVTRFKDPVTDEPRIDLMKPLQKVYQIVFRHTQQVGKSHLVPDLEMALISKFSAMVSPNRERARKMQDAVDFANMVIHNQSAINMEKLGRLAEQVYSGRFKEVMQLVEDILAGRPIQI